MTVNPFQPNAPVSEQALASLVAGVPQPLPDGYTAFLRRANGGEGFIGERYVRLWRAEELIEMNRGYNVAEFFPNLFFVGTNGGGEAYAFNISRTDPTVFEVPFIGLPSDARIVASTFDSFVAGVPERVALQVQLLKEVDSGNLDNLECPTCRHRAVSAWFTNPAPEEYRGHNAKT